ncbi:TetR/AcrR family transcriptional regulator [Candidatus Binatus sp.]|uniref:TetR/AcrR family transcriptional regulator n=1 Tax=Candidatus Binatus sp. TaxID=2811406 RepID=UPI003C716961
MTSSLAIPAGRRERQKQDRERRILAAARRLFDRKGYDATSMENVAARAGLAVGTLYNYFPSKEELLFAISRADTEPLLRIGKAILADPPDDPAEAIGALTEVMVQGITAGERRLWRELFVASIAAPDTLGARLFALDLRLIAQLTTMIERLKARGAIDASVDASRAAGLFYGICLTWSIAFATRDDLTIETMRAEISESVRITVHGILPRNRGNERAS